jgi:hypothetical protein
VLSTDTRTRILQLAFALAASNSALPPFDLSTDTETRTLELLESLARKRGLLPTLPSEEPPVPTITKSIGTSSRDYSTITSWEADVDNAGVYASGDTALGEGYDDSVFDEAATINGGGTVGLAAVTLSVAAGQRHDGTAGTGARIVRSAGNAVLTLNTGSSSRPYQVDWWEITSSATLGAGPLLSLTATVSNGVSVGTKCLIHGALNSGAAGVTGVQCPASGGGRIGRLLNSIVYRIRNTGANTATTIGVQQDGINGGNVDNCTIHDVSNAGNGNAQCLLLNTDDADLRARNNACTDAAVSGSGTALCFSATPANAVWTHNLSSDTTASGTGSLTSKSSANQYVSTVVGSEDLHLKSGADCIDAGTDLGTTPTGVNIDIDGRDRDAEGDTWDIGADEFVSVAPAGGAVGRGLNVSTKLARPSLAG